MSFRTGPFAAEQLYPDDRRPSSPSAPQAQDQLLSGECQGRARAALCGPASEERPERYKDISRPMETRRPTLLEEGGEASSPPLTYPVQTEQREVLFGVQKQVGSWASFGPS